MRTGLKVIVALIALATILYMAPLLVEGKGNECSALERRLLKPDVVGAAAADDLARQLVGRISNGSMAIAAIKKQYPNLPSEVACTVVYWRVTIDPTVGRDLMPAALISILPKSEYDLRKLLQELPEDPEIILKRLRKPPLE